ncbi:DUF1176 domain-containing protein [Oryzibacter oryziterrae]|uniref:DUF1176 domain-containing protein n=1 Tax=Oryzibacter oryziterrae TaxID=2766474 RepID=UPI001F3331FE|nr:DUF1176 domain-containing protein [Oryzibacter oryziterrae]
MLCPRVRLPRLSSLLRLAASGAVSCCLSAGFAQADTLKRFGAALVACTADLHCAVSIKSIGEDKPSTFVLIRGPESRARWVVSLTTEGVLADADRPVSLSIDNGVDITLRPSADYAPFVTASSYYITSQTALDRLMLQVQRGHDLRFAYIDITGAPHTDRFPLGSLADALNEVDTLQKRLGGDRRAAPPEDLPPAPQVDDAAMIADTGVPPRLLEWHVAASTCEAPDSADLAPIPPMIGALSDTATLYAIPCFKGAHGTGYRLYMVERGEIGGMHALTFAAHSDRFGWTGTDTLFDTGFDAASHVLTASEIDEKGCVSKASWTWDEYAFRLDRLAADPACNGSPDSGLKPVYQAP